MNFKPFLMKMPAHSPHNVPKESWYTLTIDSGAGSDEGVGALEDGEAYGRGGEASSAGESWGEWLGLAAKHECKTASRAVL